MPRAFILKQRLVAYPCAIPQAGPEKMEDLMRQDEPENRFVRKKGGFENDLAVSNEAGRIDLNAASRSPRQKLTRRHAQLRARVNRNGAARDGGQPHQEIVNQLPVISAEPRLE